MKTALVRPAAAADIVEAHDWYETQRAGLGEEFLTAVAAAIDGVVAHPEGYPVLHRETRRALLGRFPYGLFYRLVAGEVVVVACFHASRRPRDWKLRR